MDPLSWLRSAILRAPAVAAAVRAAGLAPADLDALAEFPTIDRDAWRRDWHGLAAWDAAWAATWDVARSSGSTGDPVSVVRDARDRGRMWDVLRDLRIPLEDSVTALWCALPGTAGWDRPGLHGRMLRIPASEEGIAAIEAARPTIVFTDPAGLCAWIRRPPRVRPVAVLSSALQLSPSVRSMAEDLLGTPIIDYWSTTETGPIAVSCGRGFHVLPDMIVQQAGDLVVTRLRPGASVVLRWHSGDRGRVASACPCGHAGPTILDFQGRRSAWFVRPDGARVDAWSLVPSLKGTDVRRFRLTQVRAGFELEGHVEDLGTLRSALVRLGWPDPSIRWAGPWSAGGKPEPFRAA